MGVLQNPVEQDLVTVTDAGVTVTLDQGLASIEFQNTGSNDCAYGSATVTYAKGILLYAAGNPKSFENLPSGWKITFITDTGKTTTLRQVNYL